MNNPISEWNRDFRLLALAVASQGIFFGVQLTLYNNFVVDRLNIGAHELGYVEALREVSGFMNAFFVALMVQFAPPVVAAISLMIMGVGIMAYSQVDSVFLLAVYSFVWGVGFHCWIPMEQSMALLFSPGGKKGKWLGQLRSVNSVAWLLSILICKLAYDFVGYNGLFVMAGAATVGGGFAILFASRKRPPDERGFVFKRRYGLYYALNFLQGMRKQMFITFAIFALVKIHGMPVHTTMILVLINQTLITLTAPTMGKLVDQYGERKMLSFSYIGLTFVFFGYAVVTHRPALYVLYCVDNIIFFGGIALTTYLHKIAPESDLKPSLAMGVTMNHVASVAAPLLGGFAWHYFGYQVIFFSGAVLALISLIVSQWVDPEGQLEREREEVPGQVVLNLFRERSRTMAGKTFDTWRPIVEDDETIRAALEDAIFPALMVSLVHLTGDMGIVRGEIRPRARNLADPQAGVTAEEQAVVREVAFEVLKAYRDRSCTLPPAPSRARVWEMMNFMIGEEIPEDYGMFLEGELSLNGEDPFVPVGMDDLPGDKRRDFRVLIIGAGMSGLLAAHRLREVGISFTVVEKNADVGGTWLENTYPGCRVDSPNHSYSYSFVPENWPQYFSTQQVLLDYFRKFAADFRLREHVRFQTEVVCGRFDEERKIWKVEVQDKEGVCQTLEANAIISAVGQLNRPKLPDIAGREQYRGVAFHSARWPRECDLTDKRVGVIGTGASAFQFVPEIAKQAREVFVFQRTPPWIQPNPHYHVDVPEGQHYLLNHVPFYAKWFRLFMFWRSAEGMLGAAKKDPAWPHQDRAVSKANDKVRQRIIEYIESVLGDDPELMQKCIPDFPPGGKRMLWDNGLWLHTLKRENVHLITDPIARITESGLATRSGDGYDFDVLIYGTGFQPSRMLWPMTFEGVGRRDLQAHWDGDPRAYKGVSVPGFPNFFCMYGPNTNIVVNGSIIFFSECEMRYILGCIKLLIETGRAAMDCKQDVHDRYNERIDAGNLEMAWGAPNVRSWYKNEAGRVTQNWPFSMHEFWKQTRMPDPEDYVFI